MNTSRITELEELLDRAYALRKRAYKSNAPAKLIRDINNDICRWEDEVAELR